MFSKYTFSSGWREEGLSDEGEGRRVERDDGGGVTQRWPEASQDRRGRSSDEGESAVGKP